MSRKKRKGYPGGLNALSESVHDRSVQELFRIGPLNVGLLNIRYDGCTMALCKQNKGDIRVLDIDELARCLHARFPIGKTLDNHVAKGLVKLAESLRFENVYGFKDIRFVYHDDEGIYVYIPMFAWTKDAEASYFYFEKDICGVYTRTKTTTNHIDGVQQKYRLVRQLILS